MYLQFVVYFHYLFLIKTKQQKQKIRKNMMQYVLLFNPNNLRTLPKESPIKGIQNRVMMRTGCCLFNQNTAFIQDKGLIELILEKIT